MPIDDDTLTRLVTAALEDVEVPDDGPERILAARGAMAVDANGDGPGPEGDGAGLEGDGSGWDGGEVVAFPRRRRRLAIAGGIAAALIVVIAVVGASVSGHGSPGTTASSAPGRIQSLSAPAVRGGTPTNGPTAQSGSSPAGGISLAPDGTPGQAGGSSAGAVPAAPSGTKVVQTGSLTLTVARGKVPATVGALGDAAAGLGGSVTRSQTSPDGSGTSADVTLQAPSAAFDQLVKAVEALGIPSSVTTSATDVTGSYVDLVSRINALEATRQQFLDILAKAQSISDILAVEAQITPLQTQIEQLQGQQQVLDQQTSTASLSVHVVEQAPAGASAAPSGFGRAWHQAASSFTHGMESVVAALGGIAVFLVCVAALVVVGRLGWVVFRRRLV